MVDAGNNQQHQHTALMADYAGLADCLFLHLHKY